MKRSIYADLSHQAAEVIYNNLCIKSTCFADETQKPIPADCIVALDDDPTSALWAVWLYYRIYAAYGYYPGIICAGGFGPLSRIVNGNRSEAAVAGAKRDLERNQAPVAAYRTHGCQTGAGAEVLFFCDRGNAGRSR